MPSASDFVVDVAKRIALRIAHGAIVPDNDTFGAGQSGAFLYAMERVAELPSLDAERIDDRLLGFPGLLQIMRGI